MGRPKLQGEVLKGRDIMVTHSGSYMFGLKVKIQEVIKNSNGEYRYVIDTSDMDQDNNRTEKLTRDQFKLYKEPYHKW